MNPVSGEVLLEVPALAAGHPLFAGHFPGQPIIPGAWLLDQVVHAADSLWPAPGWRLASAKFFVPVGPDQALSLLLGAAAGDGGRSFELRWDGRRVASGSLAPLAP